jgi:hypothetical protein
MLNFPLDWGINEREALMAAEDVPDCPAGTQPVPGDYRDNFTSDINREACIDSDVRALKRQILDEFHAKMKQAGYTRETDYISFFRVMPRTVADGNNPNTEADHCSCMCGCC